ncbi:MAG: proliferating cell nuclear antigen (pcna) [Candidatus Nanoarchaeia archaeon]|nr:proliferating cell nuclear antigen (pcna) [Candidatus Nanoarchaeia archaeon]
MKLTLAEPKYLKDSISVISELVNEARFKIGPNGVEMIAMDPANVAMVIFKLLSSCFVEYDVKEEVKIAIDLSRMKQVLRRASPNDILTLDVEEDKLKIQLKSKTTRMFSLPIIEVEEKEQKIPQLTFPVTIKTKSDILTSAIEDADIVAESVSFIAEQSKFTIEAEGDLNKATVDMKQGEDTNIVSDSKEKVKARYSIEYLKKMVNGSKLSDDVIIQFNKDYPLRLEYKEVDKVALSFVLAPRVEND